MDRRGRFTSVQRKSYTSPSLNKIPVMRAASAFVACNEREQVAGSQGEGRGASNVSADMLLSDRTCDKCC